MPPCAQAEEQPWLRGASVSTSTLRGAAARALSMSPADRQEIARRAAEARWSTGARPTTALDAPAPVRRLLRKYDPVRLRWANEDHRYVIVREILLRGGERALQWLRSMLASRAIRELVRSYRGAGCDDPERQKLRRVLRLTIADIPPQRERGDGGRSRDQDWAAS